MEEAENRPKVLGFVNPEKGARHYVKRYLTEKKYREWFERNYPNHTIYDGIGISKEEYDKISKEFVKSEEEPTEVPQVIEEAPQVIEEKVETPEADPQIQTLLETVSESESGSRSNSRMSFEEFVDERLLVSHDAFGNKQMKIKVLEVSDEHPPVQWKFGDRVKVSKILITIKHLDSQEVEEGEFDIEAIERELAEKRHYSSTNRWIPATDIKNGYVIGSRHTSLISDAVALDYIVF